MENKKNKIIITIGREFGSKGREIGEKLAKRLGIGFYDKELIEIAAEKSGLLLENLEPVDETVTGRFISPYLSATMGAENMNDRLYRMQSMVIRHIAAKESCVIIGRLADYVLQEEPDCIKVFVYAPFEDRVETIRKKHSISLQEAQRFVKKMDRSRKSYYLYYADKSWNQKEGKDILLNSSMFGVEGCVDILEKAVLTYGFSTN